MTMRPASRRGLPRLALVLAAGWVAVPAAAQTGQLLDSRRLGIDPAVRVELRQPGCGRTVRADMYSDSPAPFRSRSAIQDIIFTIQLHISQTCPQVEKITFSGRVGGVLYYVGMLEGPGWDTETAIHAPD